MSPADLCPLCGADPTAVEALRARVAEVERERDGFRLSLFVSQKAWTEVDNRVRVLESEVVLLRKERDEARRERDARPDPGALLAALDAIRAASATGATPAELARMVEDVQAGCIRPPTGDGVLLGGERSCFTCRHNVEVGLWGNDCTLLGSGPITTPIDLREAIGAYTNVSGASLADDCMPTNRNVRCPGWAAKEPK